MNGSSDSNLSEARSLFCDALLLSTTSFIAMLFHI